MAGFSHPDAMAPSRPAPTRMAPPRTPASWPWHPRMIRYKLFGATGLIYLILGFLVLRFIWALGAGPEVWQKALAGLSNPIYLVFHAVSLVAVIFAGVVFFNGFPKALPGRLGPLKPPPRQVLQVLLYAAWAAVTLVFAAILAGVVFP